MSSDCESLQMRGVALVTELDDVVGLVKLVLNGGLVLEVAAIIAVVGFCDLVMGNLDWKGALVVYSDFEVACVFSCVV